MTAHDGKPLGRQVSLFNASLVWPLQLEPAAGGGSLRRQWEIFENGEHAPWQRIPAKFPDDPAQFRERHYREFVSFLPFVQRFLFGEGRPDPLAPLEDQGRSPIHTFQRTDIARVRLVLRDEQAPIELDVVHTYLYFFHDLDLIFLNLEVRAENLPLATVRDILYRFGRAYPSGWDESGDGLHNAHLTELVGRDGGVLSRSDAAHREKYLRFVCTYRAPCIAEHWAYLLRPLVLDHSDEAGDLRYRLIEYHRMPVASLVAVDDPRQLSREDWIHLGLATVLNPDEPLPLHDPSVVEFETRYCQDRYWTDTEYGPNTRFICNGNSLCVVGEAGSAHFSDANRGMLGQFRHQYFQVFLIAHLYRASLLMFSDVLLRAVNALDIRSAASVRRFKRRIRRNFEAFLRFTHRYWFHELSERPHVQALFGMCSNHLRVSATYNEVRDEIQEISHYLNSDSQRRQSNMVVRLTVITILGLIATVTTGYFGMNIIAFGEGSILQRSLHGVIAVSGFVAIILFAIARSKRLADFLEALSDERANLQRKLGMLWRVFWRRSS